MNAVVAMWRQDEQALDTIYCRSLFMSYIYFGLHLIHIGALGQGIDPLLAAWNIKP